MRLLFYDKKTEGKEVIELEDNFKIQGLLHVHQLINTC